MIFLYVLKATSAPGLRAITTKIRIAAGFWRTPVIYIPQSDYAGYLFSETQTKRHWIQQSSAAY